MQNPCLSWAWNGWVRGQGLGRGTVYSREMCLWLPASSITLSVRSQGGEDPASATAASPCSHPLSWAGKLLIQVLSLNLSSLLCLGLFDLVNWIQAVLAWGCGAEGQATATLGGSCDMSAAPFVVPHLCEIAFPLRKCSLCSPQGDSETPWAAWI